jgi:L-fuconolactonase
MLAAAGASDWITGVVGWLPLDDPETTARILEGSWGPGREKGEFGQECSLLKGVRYLIHNQADSGWLLREPVMESLGLLAARDIPYDVVGVKPAHIKTALKVAERLPGLRMVFDHLNRPTIITEPKPDSLWERLMKEAARHENFYVKLSGLGTIAGKGEAWTAEDIEPCIELALRYFGPDRIFCGGDWPVSLLAGSYERTWDAYIGIIEKYADLDMRRKIFHENAERFYGLP